MLDRGDRLMQFRFQWPEFNAVFLVSLLHWLMAIVALAGMVWLVSALLKGRMALSSPKASPRDRQSESQPALSSAPPSAQPAPERR